MPDTHISHLWGLMHKLCATLPEGYADAIALYVLKKRSLNPQPSTFLLFLIR
ncbi:MAG: hypothetical protein AB1589_29695 [Cyanobacteriota bacterium]